MKVERVVDMFAAIDGCGGSDLKSESSSKHRRRSTSNKALLSERTLKLLAEKASFPNVSECRLKQIKVSFFVSGFGDTLDRPDPHALSEDYKMGSYFDTQCPIYSESLAPVPNDELGEPLTFLDLIGNRLLCFNQKVPSFQPTKFRPCVGLCDPNMGARRGFKVSRNVERIQPPKFRRGVEMESTIDLKGKYIMICCVFVPSMWCSLDGNMVYRTALASHELARRDDFVLVVVPMMRKGFTHSYSAFENFLSGFSCLAVPFWDSRRREYICSALGFDGKLKVVILDPSQKILYHGPPNMFLEFGGAEHGCFPFTPERELKFLENCLDLEDLSLNDLLGLRDTDVLCNILKDARTSISELKHKFVGIYVCSGCISLRKLQEVDEECRRQKHELEIVVVCCPDGGVPPKLHEELITDALASLKLRGWWFFPFNNTVSQRLNRMRERDGWEEGFFIVDPIEKYVDPYGLQIICDFGVDCYPFTRRNLVEKEFQRLTGLRLNSLLLPWTYVCRRKDELGSSSIVVEIPVEEALNSKIVLLYLYPGEKKFLTDRLAALMGYIEREHSSNVVEVVAVSIDGSGLSEECFMDRGWLVCRADPSKSAKLCDEYFHPCRPKHEAVVAFGENGVIQSMEASHFLESQGPPFLGNLREEIGREFEYAGYDYMRHYDYSLEG